MKAKFDLANMLREIGADTDTKADKNRQITQDEIKRLVDQKKKAAESPGADLPKSGVIYDLPAKGGSHKSA